MYKTLNIIYNKKKQQEEYAHQQRPRAHGSTNGTLQKQEKKNKTTKNKIRTVQDFYAKYFLKGGHETCLSSYAFSVPINNPLNSRN